MVDIRREVARRERAELQDISTCNTERIEQRLEECKKRYPDPRKHRPHLYNNVRRPQYNDYGNGIVGGLTNGLRDHYEYIKKELEQELKQVQFNQLHKRVLELRQVPPTETKRPPMLEDLKQKLASETKMVDTLSKKVKLLRAELNYSDQQHWGLRFHIKQLEQSGENPGLKYKLRTYADLLNQQIQAGENIITMQEDIGWAHAVQEDNAIKRVIGIILRNNYEIEKCQQLGKQYDEILVKQERNQNKLVQLLDQY
tara:strand:+ start:3054 stop:3821 length:768 start_codon:yes stop_codon:yes gene_type:complete